MKHIRYGGVAFTNNVSEKEINQFVANLPAADRASLFTVVKKLEDQGLITLYDEENSTIDQDQMEFQVPNGGDGE